MRAKDYKTDENHIKGKQFMKNVCVQKRNTMFLDNMKIKVGKLEAG
jgi:hypothetical protein